MCAVIQSKSQSQSPFKGRKSKAHLLTRGAAKTAPCHMCQYMEEKRLWPCLKVVTSGEGKKTLPALREHVILQIKYSIICKVTKNSYIFHQSSDIRNHQAIYLVFDRVFLSLTL
jgi:hypothetical protein